MYSLRYWYEKKHEDGKVIRLEIHKKNNSAAPMEIGDVVQGLSLNIDGGEDNIDAPIVSTSLVMTFVDAYDHHEAEAKKCGNWAEFYTPDATLWKVVLLCKDAGASSFRTLWGGYVTPDSYEEDLVYRGSVTIVARDNIGHLADFPFDAEGDAYGTISLRDLLAEAWIKIESPMALRAYDDWMQTEGISALDTRLNVSAFKDKSWHETIEAALYAYGASMRFIGNNEVMVSPLRYIANFGGSFTQSQPIFMTGATRMLTPAVKRIEETASYDLEAELQPLVKPSDFSGVRTLLDSDSDIYGYYLSNTEEGKGWLSSDYHTIFFDPSSFGILEADSVENLKNQMYVVAIEDYAYTAEYSRYVLAQSAKVKVTFGTGFMRKRYTDANGKPTGGYYLVPRVGTITKAYFKISVTQNGVKQYLKPNGEWTATPNVFSKANDSGLTEMEHDIDLSDFTGTILLKVEIGGIVATIPYVGISAFSIGANEAVSLLQTNRVNTNYNEENNVIIKRDPVIAPAYNTTILPSIIKNGIFYLDGVTYKPAKAWAWAGGTPQQIAVYNHLQLLTFYAKPNNVIEGNIVNGDVSRFAHIWKFEGKEHILVSGRYNYINGLIEGAILREFARYENLWGSAGEAQLPATESEETNRESSASSSSAASTYDNTTIVNIGSGGGGGASNLNDLQDVDVTASVAGSVLYFNGTGWVDKTIHSLLAELKAIGDWFYKTDDGKSIGTKFNLFSEQEISANGLSTGDNGGGGGSGGGLISQVYGTTAFGTIASESNSATFNAYAIDSLYKRIVSLEGKATAVSFVPALTSGKQIGTLSIDGVSTVLYGVDAYSKTEADGTFLKLSGGKISNGNFNPLTIKGSSTYSGIGFVRGTNSAGYLIYEGGADWAVTSENWAAGYKLIHSGNYNSYAPKLDGTGATGTWGIDISGTARYLKTSAFSAVNANELTYTNCALRYISALAGSSTNLPATTSYQNAILTLSLHDNGSTAQLYFTKGVENFYYRSQHTGDWKTVAFIDSNVASATKLATARTIWGQSFDGTGNVSGEVCFSKGQATIKVPLADGGEDKIFLQVNPNGNLLVGQQLAQNGKDTLCYGNNIKFCYGRAGSSSATAMLINSSGNVGIGTTDPQYKLDVNGSMNVLASDATARHIHVTNSVGKMSLHVAASGKRGLFDTTTDNWMIYTDSTNVYIPSKPLSVDGAVTMNSTLAVKNVLRVNDASMNAILNIANEGGTINYVHLFVSSANSSSATTRPLVLQNGYGNVGIGTNNPQYKLHINGTARVGGTLSVAGTITANSGVKVASGQALTFLDASGVEHKLTYDSTAGAFKFDGSVYATEEVSAMGLSSSASSEYLGYNLLLLDINGADMAVKHGTTITAQTATTLNFKGVYPTDIDRACIIYIIKAASSNLSVPPLTSSGIRMVNSSGAAATATATVSGVAGIMLIWDNASACWRGSII